jgi:hypothetical protein
MEFPMHWLILLLFLMFFFVVPIFLVYRHGKNVGDQQGYIRGFKEGQQSANKSP